MAEFAASDAGAEAVVADTDRFVLERVGKVVFSFGHGTHKNTNAFLGAKLVDIISYADNVSVETQGDFPAVGR